jgi:hypothetical protein
MNSILEDDAFIPDDDLPEEWLAQVFDVVALRARVEQTPQNGRRLCWRDSQLEQRS